LCFRRYRHGAMSAVRNAKSVTARKMYVSVIFIFLRNGCVCLTLPALGRNRS
jgi:hypothetical protein